MNQSCILGIKKNNNCICGIQSFFIHRWNPLLKFWVFLHLCPWVIFSSVPFRRSVMYDSLPPYCCRMTSFPLHHVLPELAQTHVHRVGNAIQPSHPLSSPSPPAFNISQHQGLFQWVSCSYQMAKVLEFQHQSFKLIFRTVLLYNGLVGFPCCPRDSQESSLTPQFKSTNAQLRCSAFFMVQLTSIHD